MSRYRIDIFGRADMAFKSFAEISDPKIEIDALVQTESECEAVGNIAMAAGDFAQIRKNGELYFQGIVKDWSYDGNKTRIVLNQMSNLLETEVFADVSQLKTQSIEQWMTAILRRLFAGTDTFERLPGLTITAESSTHGTYTATDSGVYKVSDLAVSFFKVYGVIIDITFDAKNKKTYFNFRAASNEPIKLDLSVSDVSTFEIEAASENQRPNKVIVRNDENQNEQATYYWHEDNFSGRVDTDGTTDRLLPVITQCETVTLGQGETFATAAYNKAYDILYATRYNDLIKVRMRANSALIDTDPGIGTLFILYDGETSYKTLLTGKEYLTDASIALTFGYVRKRLTEILKMKGL
jgi:hypothetical protein